MNKNNLPAKFLHFYFGSVYQPILTGNVLQKFMPPKGGTGVKIVKLKAVIEGVNKNE